MASKSPLLSLRLLMFFLLTSLINCAARNRKNNNNQNKNPTAKNPEVPHEDGLHNNGCLLRHRSPPAARTHTHHRRRRHHPDAVVGVAAVSSSCRVRLANNWKKMEKWQKPKQNKNSSKHGHLGPAAVLQHAFASGPEDPIVTVVPRTDDGSAMPSPGPRSDTSNVARR